MKRVPQRGNSLCKGLEVREFIEKEDMKTVHRGWSMDWEVKTGMKLKRERGAGQCRRASEPMEDHILRHWILSRSIG